MGRWHCDRTLPSDLPERLISEQFPEFRGTSVKPLGEGWDHQVFEVAGGWIFRFPKRREVQLALAREGAILARLGPALPVPIPVYEYFGVPSSAFPYEFVGYRKLAGTPLQELQWPPTRHCKAWLARQLGGFLSTLHALDPSSLGHAVPLADPATFSRPLARVDEYLPTLAAVDPTLCRQLERWLGQVPAVANPTEPLVVSHGDFDVEHILLDARDEKLTAIIDWGNAELAPAVSDFVGLYGLGGRPFLEQVLENYRGSVSAAHVPWLSQRQIHVALRNIGFGRAANQPDFVNAGLRGLQHAIN